MSCPHLPNIPIFSPLLYRWAQTVPTNRATTNNKKLSADEDGCPTSPSFSAALKLQQASPPPFPREGGTPAPSPRVARGWTHQTPPSPGRVCGIERNLSYTTLVRQLDTGGRQVRMLKRANETLGARVNELESGAVLRVAQSRLAEREEVMIDVKSA